MKQKLTISHLRRIIAEEVENVSNMDLLHARREHRRWLVEQEEVENVSNMDLLKARSDIFETANKFLMAIESFTGAANPAMCSAVESELKALKTHLENMCSNPAAYTPKSNVGPIKKEKRSISFKPNLED